MIVYLHGFNSSPQSHKARFFAAWLSERGLAGRFACPALPHFPDEAIAVAEAAMGGRRGKEVTFVGSSLGGFYATHLAEKHDARAVLINPAVDPHIGLRAYLGTQRNLYSGAEYELTAAHLDAWARQFVGHINPERYLLLVETGDEVLDYRKAVEKYRGARQVLVEGGDHSLASFPAHLPLIAEFAQLAAPAHPHRL
ncbi:MAG: YqiA/YcfP family alpha/beta fold hydrolase [Betaproteobacteria bacterium]